MSTLVQHWNSIDLPKKVILGLGALAALIFFIVLVRMATQPSMALLYSGLEARQAGDVVRALEQRGEAYQIEGGTIFVPHARRDELRMTLASEGMPANSAQGYELLDSLSGFGTTSQMFDAAYLRAKEGELARTIVSSPHISMARVHIAQTKQSAFQKTKIGTASVFVTPAGGELDRGQAKAIRYLVASAVAGISPDNVAVMDDQNGLISADDSAKSTSGGEELSVQLKSKAERILEARVGAGNAIVEVSVETVRQSEEITERIFDPESRVAISTDTEERTDVAEDSGSGGVTVASNLPDGDAGASENSKSNASETRERTNYEVSETQRAIVKTPGAIKRLSVAVLVNGSEDVSAPGTLTPRSAEELAQLKELVRSAVGIDETRGDVLTVQSMTFLPQAPLGTGPVQQSMFNFALDIMSLIQLSILALVIIVLAIAVVRPVLRQSAAPDLPKLAPPNSNTRSSDDLAPLTGEIDFGETPTGAMTVVDPDRSSSRDSASSKDGQQLDNPVQRLREMIETRQEETVDILRQWLEQKEQQNS